MVTTLLCKGVAVAAEVPQRVVSLAPNLTGMVTALGAGNRLVGVTPFCQAPANIIRVTGGIQAEAETVLALAPDLVLVTPLTSMATRWQMAHLGLRVEVVDIQSLEDIRRAMLQLAHWLGVAEPALPRSHAYSSVGTGVLLFGADTGYSAGRGTHADEILREAGISNIAAELGTPWPMLNEEFILSREPDWILVADFGNASTEKVLTTLRTHPIRRYLRAVREGRVITVPASVFSVPGPAALEAAQSLHKAISTR